MYTSYQDELLTNSWKRCWTNVFDVGEDQLIRDTLIWRYSEPFRIYHNINHLIGCINILKNVYTLAENPQLIEIALWYHDAIYDITKQDNEINSAILFKSNVMPYIKTISKHKLYDIIETLILDTRHKAPPSTNDGKLICDIDLSTLGEFFFDEYCQKIRLEYSIISDQLYYPERIKVLTKFLNRPTIYYTEYFQNLYEIRARENILHEIKRLNSKI